jgi:hypothetical protein
MNENKLHEEIHKLAKCIVDIETKLEIAVNALEQIESHASRSVQGKMAGEALKQIKGDK